MVKRISKMTMLVAVFTLALALPAMAWWEGVIAQCPTGKVVRTQSVSTYWGQTHKHRLDGVVYTFYNQPYVVYLNWPAGWYGRWGTDVVSQNYGSASCQTG